MVPRRLRGRSLLARRRREISSVEGLVEGGVLLEAPRGAGGFGYDPLFFYPPLGRGFAELSAEEKNRVSHRAQAIARAREWLLAAS